MIKNWLITGDCHGRVEGRLASIKKNMPEYKPEETAIIILGDVGFNYYKSKHDWKSKQRAAKFGYTIYCLRGNHEDRFSNSKTEIIYQHDPEVNGMIMYEEEFPNIKYFLDWVNSYIIMGKKVLTIPGAYSVDKWYRLQNDWQWFPDEQLTAEEMAEAEEEFKDGEFDLVLSHTCPIDWEPNDLFLSMIDQSTVDKTMEVWMSKFKNMISWGVWLFGHYHADRLERPYVEQFYEEVENLETIIARWDNYKATGELDWWLPKARDFYMGVEHNG
jgi:3-oxoacid CoA-transferase subunit A